MKVDPACLARASALLDSVRSRGEVKAASSALEGDDALRLHVLYEGRRRGAELPDAALEWPAKKLLRHARAREAASRVRINPVARDEDFLCAHCGKEVPPHGRSARDHCPWCLRSVHVDVVPGDRAAGCGGLLEPQRVESRGEEWMIHYRCRKCGQERRNRAMRDGDPADDWEQVVALSVTT